MNGWAELAEEYGRFHRARGNRVCHAIGIPLIVLAIVRWTLWPPYQFPVAALALPLYFRWGWRLGIGMTAVFVVLWTAATRMPGWTALAAFAIGWAFQAVGHAWYERAKPAFARNLVHLLVGPAWLLRELSGGLP